MNKKFSMDTIVSGALEVTIEGIGTFNAEFDNMSLIGFAGNVYAVLTGKMATVTAGFFKLVSFDPRKGKLVVRVRK